MLALILTVWLAAFGSADSFQRYVAVIDAGSSGSRIHLYERTLAGNEIQLRELFSDKGGEALSGFEDKPVAAGPRGVQPLLNKLRPRLDQLGIRPDQVQVNLLATAGMRLVEARNPEAAAAIYASARSALAASHLAVGRVETLSGQREGIYAWVDINHLSGTLNGQGQPSIGVVEVGGASTQLAFESRSAGDAEVATVSILGRNYRVFSTSWLGLGQNEARRSMIESGAEGAGTADNACYPNAPSSSGNLAAFNADIGGYAIRAGNFDFARCSALYARVIQPFRVASASSGTELAAMRVVGIASVYYALNDWRALDSPANLDTTVKSNCEGERAWGAKVSPFLHGRTDKFAQNACANATFVSALLFGPHGLGVSPERFRALNDINGQQPSWTRGLAIVGP